MMQSHPLIDGPCADSESGALRLRCCGPSGKSATPVLSPPSPLDVDADADADATASSAFQQLLHDACLSARTCSTSSRHSDCDQTDDDDDQEEEQQQQQQAQTDVDAAAAFRSPSPTAGAHDNHTSAPFSSAFSPVSVPAVEATPTSTSGFFVAAPFSPCFTSLATLAASAATLEPAQSQTPQQASSPPPVAAEVPFDFASRFRVVRTLQSTLFGAQLLCEDLQAPPTAVVGEDGCGAHRPLVVVKESAWSRIEQKRATAQVGEDVRKEARIMRWLGVERAHHNQTSTLHNSSSSLHSCPAALSNAHVDRHTSGLSDAFWDAHADPATGLLSSKALESLAAGARFIAPLHGEFDTSSNSNGRSDDRKHYLATGFAAHGDLFGVVSNAPGGRLTEAQARPIFAQLLQAVQYSHARSVAHLDLSIENTCLTADGEVRLIDWGLAVLHADCGADSMGGQRAATIDPIKRLSLANDLSSRPTTTSIGLPCICASCRSTPAQLAQREAAQIDQCLLRFPDLASQASLAAPLVAAAPDPDDEGMMDIDSGAQQRLVPPSARSVLSRSRSFLMRPVCELQMRPGKPFTTAPELADPHRLAGPWDAYAADSFALGVLLFVVLTGRPPFRAPDARTDTWFRWMSSGDWLVRERTWGGQHAHLCTHYTHLSANACALIDLCFKPQHLRPTADQMLAHPWLDVRHPGSATPMHQHQ